MRRRDRTKVFLLTYCRSARLLWSSLLSFDSLRVGFPDAEIFVYDNQSVPEARGIIRRKTRECGGHFHQLKKEVLHQDFIENILRTQKGAVVFVDPDMCFWESCEDWKLKGLFAGRYLPRFFDIFSKTITMERLHTSFLWIPDVEKLQDQVRWLQRRFFEFHPIQPFMFKSRNEWYRYDTAANLYAAFKQEAYPFQSRELSCYDHLFCGTHVDEILEHVDARTAGEIKRMYALAKQDIHSIKGIWKLQDDFFAKRSPHAENAV